MRIVKEIEIEGKKAKALFDSGATYSYVTRKLKPDYTKKVPPKEVGLGGKDILLTEQCIVNGKIDGLDFDMSAYIIDEHFETEFGIIDVIVGALTLEAWWIKLDPKTGELDLTMLKKREFQEL